jgi:hypothetical protein
LFSTAVITSDYTITDQEGNVVSEDVAFVSTTDLEVTLVINKAGE